MGGYVNLSSPVGCRKIAVSPVECSCVHANCEKIARFFLGSDLAGSSLPGLVGSFGCSHVRTRVGYPRCVGRIHLGCLYDYRPTDLIG